MKNYVVQEKVFIGLRLNKDNTWLADIDDGTSDGVVRLVAENTYPVKFYYSRTDLNGSGCIEMDLCHSRQELLDSLNWCGKCGCVPSLIWDFDVDKTENQDLLNIIKIGYVRRLNAIKAERAQLDDRITAAEQFGQKSKIVSMDKTIHSER